ncbi:LacI family DNA-binding transcriptional regulator [Furfurilactobacillus curtus]|uniref:LacI family transcriptional regulator n=1 Tax=Furfurilactobacillus curtus TaxID=1746200 RepID=A0ABQ5JML5_9LACO
MTQRVTIADIAKRTGLASSTVSRALRDSPRVKLATRQRVQQIANELNFRPNTLAQSMRNQRTNAVGVVVSNILNPYFTELLRGISDELSRVGDHLILFNTDEQAIKETNVLKTLTGQMVDGLIVASTGGIDNYEDLTETTPTVFVDRLPNTASINRYDAILTDNPTAAAGLTQCLLDSGAHRVGFLGGQVTFSANERLNGYQQALLTNQLPAKRNLVRYTDYTLATTTHAVHELQQQAHVDSLLVTDTVILAQVLTALHAMAQPITLKLATFDYLPWFDFLQVPLVAAQQATYQMGHAAVTTLLQRIAQPDVPITLTRFPVTYHQNF